MHNWLLNGCIESITRTLNARGEHTTEQIVVIAFMTLKSPNKEVKISATLIHIERDFCVCNFLFFKMLKNHKSSFYC